MTQATLARDADLRAEVEQLRAANKGLSIDLANTQTLLLAESRKVNSLEKQLEKARGQNVTQQDMLRVFDHWCRSFGKRKGTKFGERRQGKVRARMREGFTADDLIKAVDGCKAAPYQLYAQHIAKPLRGAARRDDLDYICQDEAQVERFMEIAELGPENERGQVEPERPQKRRPAMREVEARSGEDFVDALVDRGLRVIPRHGYGAKAWMGQCPVPEHDDSDPSLSITELGDGRILLRCFAGCETEDVLGSLGWSFAHLRGRGSTEWAAAANTSPLGALR